MPLFEDLEFDGDTMLMLDDEALKLDLGIRRGNHRAAILTSISKYKKGGGREAGGESAALAIQDKRRGSGSGSGSEEEDGHDSDSTAVSEQTLSDDGSIAPSSARGSEGGDRTDRTDRSG